MNKFKIILIILILCLVSPILAFADEYRIQEFYDSFKSYDSSSLVVAEDEKLKTIFQENVLQKILSTEDNKYYKNQLINFINNNSITESQYFVLVDRNPNAQIAMIFYMLSIDKITLIGVSPVSTGGVAFNKYITPTGIFENKVEHMSFRAMGTKNEKGIRGFGIKNMRVYDFGWNKAHHSKKNEIHDIRFAMHATDPDYLEKRLGTPSSQGCIRLHTTFNFFLDYFSILDKNYLLDKKSYVLLKEKMPVQNPGKFLIVIDSSQPDLSKV